MSKDKSEHKRSERSMSGDHYRKPIRPQEKPENNEGSGGKKPEKK
ncbi:hypothetical protein [Rhodothalassium salexigens]|nr:hypothetical protein [Rhodothalassium salexigens]MBB4211834.1 hypothetical protein [Rhodothalassium salexigens DSM 2132]